MGRQRSSRTPDAEIARTILSFADRVELAVDGVPQPLDEAPAGLQDWAGTPLFVTEPGGALSAAAHHGRHVLAVARGPVEPGASLVLAGSLKYAGTDGCPCCGDGRDLVVIDLDNVVLTHDGRKRGIDTGELTDPSLQLNRGYLRRTREHLNQHHGADLRRLAGRRSGVAPGAVIAAQLAGLAPAGAVLEWVTPSGATRVDLRFPRPARDVDELGTRLRKALGAAIC